MITKLEAHISKKYKDQFKTWKKVSLDDNNGISMIDSEKKCFDYDTGIVKLHNKSFFPKCVDGVIIKNNKLYFIEFKNGKIDDKTTVDLRLKACESLIEFSNILKRDGLEIEYQDLISLKPIFILVFNFDKNYLQSKTDNINQYFLEETQAFAKTKTFLSKYINNLYEKVNITRAERFQEMISNE